MTGATPSGSGCQSFGPQPASPFSLSGIPSAALLDEITAHLGAAIMQSISTDDQIIMEHVRAAHGLATILRKAQQ